MKRNHKFLAAKMFLIEAAAVTLVMFIGDFTPRASMKGKGKGKGQQEAPATARVSAAAKYRSPGNLHKLLVSDRDLAKAIELQGGRHG